MNIIQFTYDKQDGSANKEYFVGITSSDSVYLNGYDLISGGYKTFLKSKMRTFTYWGDESEDVVRNASVISESQLFDLLGYGADAQKVTQELGVTTQQLAKLLSDRTGRQVVSLGTRHYFVYGVKERVITVNTDSGTLSMKIREGVIEYSDEKGEAITMLEFTRRVLGSV